MEARRQSILEVGVYAVVASIIAAVILVAGGHHWIKGALVIIGSLGLVTALVIADRRSGSSRRKQRSGRRRA